MSDLMDHFADHGCIVSEALRAGSRKITDMLADGRAYVMTLADVEDQPHSGLHIASDATGVQRASWRPLGSFRWQSVALDVPLCSGCDAELDAYGNCQFCGE